jgi:hypothetical protein
MVFVSTYRSVSSLLLATRPLFDSTNGINGLGYRRDNVETKMINMVDRRRKLPPYLEKEQLISQY